MLYSLRKCFPCDVLLLLYPMRDAFYALTLDTRYALVCVSLLLTGPRFIRPPPPISIAKIAPAPYQRHSVVHHFFGATPSCVRRHMPPYALPAGQLCAGISMILYLDWSSYLWFGVPRHFRVDDVLPIHVPISQILLEDKGIKDCGFFPPSITGLFFYWSAVFGRLSLHPVFFLFFPQVMGSPFRVLIPSQTLVGESSFHPLGLWFRHSPGLFSTPSALCF